MSTVKPRESATNRGFIFRDGYCACGCGQRTGIAKFNKSSRGHVAGQPFKYARGHNSLVKSPGEKMRRRGRGPQAKMTREQVFAAWRIYYRANLTIMQLAELLWREFGYSSAQTCGKCLSTAFASYCLPLSRASAKYSQKS